MKKILLLLGAFALVLGSVALISNTDIKTAVLEQLQDTDLAALARVSSEDAEAAASSYYIYPTGGTTYEVDTVTNATNDTVLIPTNLLTDRNWAWAITATNLSGTTAIIAIVQEASYLDKTTSAAFDWVEIGRDTFSATGVDWIRGTHTTGFKHRLILDGSGTQSTRVRTKFIAKPN